VNRTLRQRIGDLFQTGIWIPGLVVLLWSLAQLLRDPGFFWCDDFQSQTSPFLEEIVRSWREGEWPILSRNSWCTGNLAGEFQLGTFSLPFNALLLAVWSFPLSLASKAAAVSIAHLIWLATGVFLLGRLRGLATPFATAAALATALSGWIIVWGATDWISFLAGFSWVPWVWWSLQTALTSDSVWKRWLRPALCVALLITSGNTFAIAMVPLVGGWLGLQAVVRDRNWPALGPLTVAGLLGVALSAPAWGLLIETATASPRWGWGMAVHHSWIVPWRAWPGLILPSFVTPWPDFFGSLRPHASLELACGLVPVAALVAALVFQPRVTLRRLPWELLLLAGCVLLVSLPSVGQFRWSFRWLPLFHLVLALTAADILQHHLARRAAVCGAVLISAVGAAVALFGENRSPALSIWLLGFGIAWPLAERFVARAWAEWLPAAVITLSLGAAFWYLPTHQSAPKYSFNDSLLDPAPLDRDRLYLSLYSFSEISHARSRAPGHGNLLRPLNTMHAAGLRFLNGYSSFPGREVQALFDAHGNVHPVKAESMAGPQGERLLLFLGVDGIVFSTDYAHFAAGLGPEWEKVAEAPEGVAYHREPRRFQPVKALTFLFDRPGVPLAQPELRLIAERRNSVTVEVTPPAIPPDAEPVSPTAVAPIAFVRPFLAGYEARLNGQLVAVRAYRDILPIVELPANARGILELRYRPQGLTRGLWLTAAAALAMLAIALGALLRRRRNAAS